VTQRGAITPLSTRWNFQSYYRYLGLAAKVAPIIDHFPGEPKPWDFDYWPNGMFSRAYGKIASSIDADSVAEMNLRALPIKTLRNGAKILKMRTVRRSEYLRTVALFDAYEQTAIG
jgi:lipopolysaccharide biosynthesis glycosyltransferase